MTPDQLIIIASVIAGIVFVWWFFLGKRGKAVQASGSIEIMVDGGYSPETIEVPVGKPVTLRLYRKDPSSCLEEIVISDFKVRKTLPLHEWTEITLTPDHPGTFRFSCGMNMYHGSIIVH